MTMSVRLAAALRRRDAPGAGASAPSRRRPQDDQAQQFTPEFREVHKSFDPKHTPKIVAPDSVKRGEWFNVTVSVGAGVAASSLPEHFVRYIALYKDTVEIARVYLHPVYSSPTVTFTVALDEGGCACGRVAEPTHSVGVGGLEEDRPSSPRSIAASARASSRR